MKKIVSVLAAALLFLTVLGAVGCAKDDRTEISIGYWINNTNERTNNQKIFDAFEAAYPDYKIKTVQLQYDSYGEEVPRMYNGNTLPDVIWMREEYLPVFADEGIIVPIDSYVEADAELDTSKYVHNALEFCSYNDQLYALPRDIGVQVVAFNLDIMGDTPLPENDWTWEDMVSLGKQFMVADGDSYSQYGLGWLDWKGLVYSNGGTLFADGGKTATFNDPKTIEALQFYSDLANDPDTKIMPSAEASQGLGNAFLGKKAAFAVVGSWDFLQLKKVGINYDIRPFPSGPNGEGTMRLSGLPLCINSKSTQKDMAYELIKFLCYSDTAQTLQAEYSIAMPSIESIARSDVYTNSQYAPPSIDIYFEALENTFIEQHFKNEQTALAVFDDYLYQIYNKASGELKRAEDIADEMNAAIQAELNG